MKASLIVGCVVVVAAAGIWFYNKSDDSKSDIETGPLMEEVAETAPLETSAETPPDPDQQADAAFEHTSQPAPTSPQEADDFLRTEYEGADAIVNEILAHDYLLEKIATAAEAIWRDENPTTPLNFLVPKGKMITERREGATVISPKNHARYTPYLAALDSVDEQRLISGYLLVRPLLRQAHEKLGNAHVTWDALVIQVLDKMIAFESPQNPPKVTGSGKYVIFEDPDLEKRPPIEKLMIRMGPAHTEQLQDKLKRFRTRLAQADRSQPAAENP